MLYGLDTGTKQNSSKIKIPVLPFCRFMKGIGGRKNTHNLLSELVEMGWGSNQHCPFSYKGE